MAEHSPTPEAPADFDRHVELENALNFRDVGGYPTQDGRTVRWRRLFRAGGLSELTAADLVVLRALGIQTVLDLRSTAEWESGTFPVKEISVALHHLPIVEEILDPTRYELPEGMLAARYQDYTRIGAPNIGRAISMVAEPESHPVVVHCLAGKDRTGVIIALVLSLLGVDDDTIAEDYALSNLAMARLRERAAAVPDRPLRTEEVANEVFSAKPSNITSLFEALRASHGSVENYVVSTGVEPAEIDALRASLLE
ncbi:MAG: tyrosine-protein phosphatase [Acidimicrobiales bacterium]